MSWRAAAAWVAAFATLVLLASQLIEDAPKRSTSSGTSPSSAARTVKVMRVVDGDTIIVENSRGEQERVRYIGVDTPESVKPNSPVECFGHEASNFNRGLVEGKSVRLVPDAEPKDRFGRTLAFVHVGERMVNAELLRLGYARTIEIPPNTSKAGEFDRLQSVAMRTNRGLWKACRR